MASLHETAVERPYGEPPKLDAKPDYKVAFKRAAAKFSQDQCTDLAASLTYYSVQAMVPALIAGISLLGIFGDGKKTTTNIVDSLAKIGGVQASKLDQVTKFLNDLQTTSGAGVAFALGILLSLWSASGYVGAFARMQNRVYDVAEGRPVWKLRPWLYLVTIIQTVLLVIAALAMVATGSVAKELGSHIGLGSTAVTVWDIVKWPFIVIIVIFIIGFMFWSTPNVRRPIKQGIFNAGAALAFFVWAIGSALFAWYVTNMGSYGKYGQLSIVIILLLWLWITNLAMLFGAEFDSEVLRTRQLKSGYPAEELILLPVRDDKEIEKKAEKYDAIVERAHELRLSSGVPDEAVSSMMPVVPGSRSDERTVAAQAGNSEKRPLTPQARTVERAPDLANATKDVAPDLTKEGGSGSSAAGIGTRAASSVAVERERAEIEAEREARRRRALVESDHKRAVRDRIEAEEAKVKEQQKKAEAEREKERKRVEAERPLQEQWSEIETTRSRYEHPNTREFRAVTAERNERRRRWFSSH